MGCRFVNAYKAIVLQGQVTGGQYVAVHGCGGVGLSAIMIASALGAQVIAVDINKDALNFAKELGDFVALNASNSQNIIEEIKDMTNVGAHISVDALGSQITCFNSIGIGA